MSMRGAYIFAGIEDDDVKLLNMTKVESGRNVGVVYFITPWSKEQQTTTLRSYDQDRRSTLD